MIASMKTMMIMMTTKTVKASPRTIGMHRRRRRWLRRISRTRRRRRSRRMLISIRSQESIPGGYMGYKISEGEAGG